MDAPRAIPIHQSLHRPELVLGGEREPVMLSSLLSILTGITGAASFTVLPVVGAVLFYFGMVLILRRMAKADPMMTKVWLRHVKYRHYYAARPSAWSKRGFYAQAR